MTGPEHYQEAIAWSRRAHELERGPARDEATDRAIYHATMANTAATAMLLIGQHRTISIAATDEWIDALDADSDVP